eukprot:CAMPEP_0172520966 /NCGR_PEP_ID=MMETSP1066-20121228/292304_1 /TAXON_ID=671091 /ORGANISM="Coscinodiscus wailesii, Strain CCMP2513" /LENGTH=217 /DNA_ID=CAMNT_0013303797 /DNA_START=57 /DNA_END=710 /DNA_ORIENTATION=-
MKVKDINCFGLYTGQKTTVTELAVSLWSSTTPDTSKPGPVLIVQAGAAASGLTLTAASKMFLMEPFSRQEEEQQAYARCHRYGQTRDVQVKVYYAPVSVESRLLRWRKRSVDDKMTSANGSTNYVFSQLHEEEGDDLDEESVDAMELESGEKIEGDEDGADKDGGSVGEDDGTELAEDSLCTQFLLGLVDEDGNPTRGAPNNGSHRGGVSETVASSR